MAEKVYIKFPPEWEYIGGLNDRPSPIRIRREIVPGEYSDVCISIYDDTRCKVGLQNHIMNANQLREAAHLFNQIAEVLEENAG